MASYKTHTCFNIFVFLPILSAPLFFYIHPSTTEWLCFTGTFLYSTFFMNPDLDLVHKIKWNSLRGFFAFPFFGYSKIFKHRGYSHKLLLGSLTRILWATFWLSLLLILVYSIKETAVFYKTFLHQFLQNKSLFGYGFGAICLSDASHILLDSFKR